MDITEVPSEPGMPEVIEITNNTVTLHWKAPESDGNSPIINYVLEYHDRSDFTWADIVHYIYIYIHNFGGIDGGGCWSDCPPCLGVFTLCIKDMFRYFRGMYCHQLQGVWICSAGYLVVVVKQCGCRKVGQSQIQKVFFFFEAILVTCSSHCFSVSHICFSPFCGPHWLQFPQLPFLLSYYISICLNHFNHPEGGSSTSLKNVRTYLYQYTV